MNHTARHRDKNRVKVFIELKTKLKLSHVFKIKYLQTGSLILSKTGLMLSSESESEIIY